MHWATSLTAWGVALLLMFIFGAAHNFTRVLGLGALAAILLDLAYHHRMPMEAAVLLAAWIAATMPPNTAHSPIACWVSPCLGRDVT
ncbi:hypothetical protein [Alicyclobacillus sacchari]|uniref:hypothetical protein n=1 Tax=Alicyclobacillus sacchari TaxID=392010 RepID=UPI0024E0F3DC|nr:hypothetical protein [Alicyclobacillus sacchari]